MAWRMKVFLLLVCLTGVCVFCFQQILVPFTFNYATGPAFRKTNGVKTVNEKIAHAQSVIDKVKRRGNAQLVDKPERRKGDHSHEHLTSKRKLEVDLQAGNKRVTENLFHVTTESHVTVSANGSLLYETDVENSFTLPTLAPETAADEHVRRIKHLQEQCNEIPHLKNELVGRANMTDFFASSKYKFAYCKVPKSGSTFWMQLFMGLVRGSKYSGLMSHWTRAEIHERTRRFHVNPLKVLTHRLRTIVVSRNPYTRLYSAYIDKVFMPLFWDKFKTIPSVTKLPPIYVNTTVRQSNLTLLKRPNRFQEHIKHYHRNLSSLHTRHVRSPESEVLRNCLRAKPSRVKLRECLRRYQRDTAAKFESFPDFRKSRLTKLIKLFPICANRVTFEEFLQFIISEAKAKQSLEPHWAPITHLCRPCKFNTYKIVKQESFAADVEHSLTSVGINITAFEGLSDSLNERRAEASIPGIVGVLMAKATVPEVKACIPSKEIAERIWKSFQIQGFISDDISLPINELPEDIKGLKVSLVKLALDAVKRKHFTKEQQKAQRRKHLVEAYSHVSPDVIKDIQSIYILDFNLFNYSITPPHLKEPTTKTTH